MRPQAAGMSCYSVAEEITSVRGDYLVELRGFKPLTKHPRADGQPLPVLQGLLLKRASSVLKVLQNR